MYSKAYFYYYLCDIPFFDSVTSKCCIDNVCDCFIDYVAKFLCVSVEKDKNIETLMDIANILSRSENQNEKIDFQTRQILRNQAKYILINKKI